MMFLKVKQKNQKVKFQETASYRLRKTEKNGFLAIFQLLSHIPTLCHTQA